MIPVLYPKRYRPLYKFRSEDFAMRKVLRELAAAEQKVRDLQEIVALLTPPGKETKA